MALHKMVNGEEVACTPEEEKLIREQWEIADRENAGRAHWNGRINEYPSVTDQLDLLWHAMDNGEIPIAKEFFDKIKSIKERHPKG